MKQTEQYSRDPDKRRLKNNNFLSSFKKKIAVLFLLLLFFASELPIYPSSDCTWPFRAQGLCESRGGHPRLPSLISLMVSVDVKHHNRRSTWPTQRAV